MICYKCDGFGFVEYLEQGYYLKNPCSFCGESGHISDEYASEYEIDQLTAFLADMAIKQEKESATNDDINHHLMSPFEYYQMRYFIHESHVSKKLQDMKRSDLEFLISWLKQIKDPEVDIPANSEVRVKRNLIEDYGWGDVYESLDR